MVEQKLPTLQQIKKAIPEKCFQVRAMVSHDNGRGTCMHAASRG